jgi:hypothetical protein
MPNSVGELLEGLYQQCPSLLVADVVSNDASQCWLKVFVVDETQKTKLGRQHVAAKIKSSVNQGVRKLKEQSKTRYCLINSATRSTKFSNVSSCSLGGNFNRPPSAPR